MRPARRAVRRTHALTDQAVERYFAGMRVELTPDPLFRRRMRAEVVNRFVAAREGIVPIAERRVMGRLGRAVLHASFVTAVFVSGAMAVSENAIPGDALYPLKLQVERLRVSALPAELHDDLAGHVLAERIDELRRLAERGDWARVATQTAIVQARYEEYAATEADGAHVDRYRVVLGGLLERLPAPARAAVEEVMRRTDAARPDRKGQDTRGEVPTAADRRAPVAGEAPPHTKSDGPGLPGEDESGTSDARRKQPKTASPAPRPSDASSPAVPTGSGHGRHVRGR